MVNDTIVHAQKRDVCLHTQVLYIIEVVVGTVSRITLTFRNKSLQLYTDQTMDEPGSHQDILA